MGEGVGRPLHRDPVRAFLVGLLGGAAVAHVTQPRFFEPMVPDWVPGTKRFWNLASAGAEMASALLLARSATSRAGGRLAAATLVGVLPANVQAAIDGGYRALPEPLDSQAAAWVRVPMQAPLVWLAWRVSARG